MLLVEITKFAGVRADRKRVIYRASALGESSAVKICSSSSTKRGNSSCTAAQPHTAGREAARVAYMCDRRTDARENLTRVLQRCLQLAGFYGVSRSRRELTGDRREAILPASSAPDSTRVTQRQQRPFRIVPFHSVIRGAHSSMTTTKARTDDRWKGAEGDAALSGTGKRGCTS